MDVSEGRFRSSCFCQVKAKQLRRQLSVWSVIWAAGLSELAVLCLLRLLPSWRLSLFWPHWQEGRGAHHLLRALASAADTLAAGGSKVSPAGLDIANVACGMYPLPQLRLLHKIVSSSTAAAEGLHSSGLSAHEVVECVLHCWDISKSSDLKDSNNISSIVHDALWHLISCAAFAAPVAASHKLRCRLLESLGAVVSRYVLRQFTALPGFSWAFVISSASVLYILLGSYTCTSPCT